MLKLFLDNPDLLANVFETMRDGLMVVDKEGNILFFNKAAEKITGYRREDVIGKSCMVLDTDTCMVLTESGRQKNCDLFKKGSVTDKKCRIRRTDGQSVYLLKNAELLKDVNGEVIGAVESMTDVTSLYMKEMELEELKQDLREEYSFHGLLGKSAPMMKMFEQIKNAAMSEAPVLIGGESGTGKNLVASAVHALSRRGKEPFVHMNCASLNESLCESELFGHRRGSFTGAVDDRMGRFEAANKGTLFLDEIGDIPLSMQVKLLRVLEEKVVERVGDHKPIPVNIRFISATNKDLDEQVVKERFREDLFYRVNSIFISVPPLRERVDDIPLIVGHYLKKIALVNHKEIRGITPPVLDILEHYSWPGNVRQLINVLEHSAVTAKGDIIGIKDLPDYLIPNRKTEGNKEVIDSKKIQSALSLHKGNKTLAAKHLGISRVMLWKKLKALGLDD